MEVLTEVTASDLMQTDVVTLAVEDKVEQAVAILEEYHIGGAPVVDSTGALLGFLSSHDVARTEHVREGRLATERGDYAGALDEDVEDDDEFYSKDDYSPEILGSELVKDWMNPDVISVAPSTSLKEICKVMTAKSVHRVLVVEEERLRGIVSTFDVVRYLAQNL